MEKKYGSQVGGIGPNIILKKTGKHQNPFATIRPGAMLMKVRKMAFSNYFMYNLYHLLSATKSKVCYTEKQRESGYVYGIHGSVMILRKKCIDEFLKDTIGIFMYGEELYVAEKLKEEQFSSYYDMELKTIHNENQVTGKIVNKRKQLWHSQSMNFLIERYWK